MGSIGDQDSAQYEKFWHRKQCSNRLFIGPWDLKSPPVSNEPHEIAPSYSEQCSNLQSLPESTSTVQQQLKPPPLVTPNSDGTSFITARSKNTNVSSGVFSPFPPTGPYESEDDDEYCGLDYDTSEFTSTTHDLPLDRASTHTVRPSPKLLTSQSPQATTALDSQQVETTKPQKKSSRRRLESRNLLWKQAGNIFISRKRTHQPEQLIALATGATLKQGPVVCMRTVTDRVGSGPTRYKASKESRYSLLTEKWKQVELVLTRSYISAYSSSTFFWPKHRLEYRIHFDGPKKPKGLELFLFSPIDYTFGLRYPSTAGKIPTTVVLLFKARTFLQCQEWYMQLYKILPPNAKRPFPSFCEVYIPMLDLNLNLPLEETEGCYDITLDDVKNAVISVIEADGQQLIDDVALCLCWSTKDRVEWVHWTQSTKDQRTDGAICPQSIEQTHRLELRQIEHSPTTILLNQNITLKEPTPIEGFLICTSNFFGLAAQMARRPQYFASFDQYLLYIPSLKATEPADACTLQDTHISERLRTVPHVTLISPYSPQTTPEVELEEIQRRMSLLIESKGMIDLTEVSFVRRRFHDNSDPIIDDSQTSMLRTSFRETQSCSLELIMENGLHVQFEAYSAQTCEVWAHTLSQLVLYWKARKEAKGEAHIQKQMTDSLLNEKNEVAIACTHSEDDKQADTRIWSFCLYDQCRDVVKSGILYYKPHHRGTYTKKFFILAANGWLLFFDVFNRMVRKKSNNHERKGAIDIAGCYFYSGVDCSKKRKGSNMAKIYESHLKAYPSGLVSHDTPMACVFSIWKPAIRKYFSPKQQRLRVYHQDQRLNPKGQNIMFLAQSQGEKEEWLYALNSVAEHMMRASSP